MKNLGGGGVNKVHYGLCENGEFWEILLVESGTLRLYNFKEKNCYKRQ